MIAWILLSVLTVSVAVTGWVMFRLDRIDRRFTSILTSR